MAKATNYCLRGKTGELMTNDQLINQDSGKVEYGTPPDIIERARNTMGGIDLDPASNEFFNKNVKALTFFDGSEGNNGLLKHYWGNVWINHPYGRGEKACKPNCKKKKCDPTYNDLSHRARGQDKPQGWRGHCITEDIPGNFDWIKKLVSEYHCGNVQQAICITFASMGEKWFRPLLAYPQCFLYGRVRFLDENNIPSQGNAPKSSVITYFGPKPNLFQLNFVEIGAVKKLI